MLSNNPRQDLFVFRIPSNFFDKDIVSKYDALLNQYDMTLGSIADVVNESIQAVTFPGFEFTPIEQAQQRDGYSSSTEYFRQNENIQQIVQKTVTVTFRHVSGYLTYFCLLEHYFQAYSFKTDKKNFGTWPVQILDMQGNIIYTLNMKRMLFTGISDLALSYTNTDRSFLSFECTFYYSEFDTVFSLPELNLKS